MNEIRKSDIEQLREIKGIIRIQNNCDCLLNTVDKIITYFNEDYFCSDFHGYGSWISKDKNNFACSKCKGTCDSMYNFCPNCGARMLK